MVPHTLRGLFYCATFYPRTRAPTPRNYSRSNLQRLNRIHRVSISGNGFPVTRNIFRHERQRTSRLRLLPPLRSSTEVVAAISPPRVWEVMSSPDRAPRPEIFYSLASDQKSPEAFFSSSHKKNLVKKSPEPTLRPSNMEGGIGDSGPTPVCRTWSSTNDRVRSVVKK
jgi:hypothetical protein